MSSRCNTKDQSQSHSDPDNTQAELKTIMVAMMYDKDYNQAITRL